MAEERTRGRDPGRSRKVLLVDDEAAILEVNTEILQALGYTVYAARSGQKAVEIYKENKNDIDLVILDMIMPGMSGEETFYTLKTIDPALKVILLSGYSINDRAAKILEDGCGRFVQKPFKIASLAQKIREVLDE